MRSDAIKPGDVIAGKYRVRAILSRSRGFLVEAFHTEFDQRVVIRVLSTNLVDEKEVERFRREARVIAKLESEHVARIVDVGSTQDGAFYFARQYLEGQDLATYLKKRGALPFAEAVLFILQAAEAVAETHVHSIILRELQPAHLFVTQRLGGQQIKVIDFGTAKLMREAAAPTAGAELTATSMFGLSCYSSPELVRKAKHVDVRTDVWSLGAILYQLLAARPPFAGEMAALMLAITRDDPVPLTSYRRDLPSDIDNIISWALAKDPDGRFANVHGFAHALLPFASAEGQLLVQRIGEITTAGKQRKSHAPVERVDRAIERDHPITMDGTDVLEDDDDDPKTAYRMPGSLVVGPGYQANAPEPAKAHPSTPPLERTVFIQNDYAAASPASPQAMQQVHQAIPNPRVPTFAGAADPRQSHPAWQPMAVPPPPGSGPGAIPAIPAPPNPSHHDLSAQAPFDGGGRISAVPPQSRMATIQSSSASGGYVAPGGKPPPKGQKMALAAMAGAVVLLSVVAVVVVFKSRGPGDGAEATATTATASAAPAATVAPAGTAAATPTAPEPVAAEPASTAAATVAAPATTAPTKTVVAATPATPALPASTGAAKLPTKVKVDPPPVVAAPPPPATAGGDNGTLVAVAVGGTCAFSINGASKGTSSTLKVSVKPGTYSVTCAPASGSSKSKSVTVASGGTAMAMFKL